MSSRRTALAAIAAAGSLALTACGGGSTSGAEPTSVAGAVPAAPPATASCARSQGLMPIAPSVAFEYGIKEGIFEEHGFEVDTSSSVSGTATLPAVSTGQIHFDIGNPMSWDRRGRGPGPEDRQWLRQLLRRG